MITQKAPGGSRGGWFTRTCGFVPQFAWRASARWSQRGPPGLVITQKAPGGSRGTPGHAPVRLPCDAGSSRGSACRRAAWMAGWFSGPESPGFHPGLLGAETGGSTVGDRRYRAAALRRPRSPGRRPFARLVAPWLRPRRAKPAGAMDGPAGVKFRARDLRGSSAGRRRGWSSPTRCRTNSRPSRSCPGRSCPPPRRSSCGDRP